MSDKKGRGEENERERIEMKELKKGYGKDGFGRMQKRVGRQTIRMKG